MLLQEAIQLYLDHRRERVLPSSYVTYEFWLNKWVAWRTQRRLSHQLAGVDQTELESYLKSLHGAGLEPASLDATWRIWRALFRLLARRGLTSPHHAGLFGPDGVPQPRVKQVIREPYDEGEIERLLAAIRGTAEQVARNRAMIILLWESGARSAEICGLQDSRVDLPQRQAVITGKGEVDRWIFWGPRGAAAIAEYVTVRTGSEGPLFRSLKGDSAITTSSLRQVLKRLAKRAGVKLLPHGPVHNFRRTFAHAALDADISDLDLQQLMGHKSIVSTQTYTRRNPGKLKKIHGKIYE